MTRSVVNDAIARNKSRMSTLSQARSSYYGTLKAIETGRSLPKGMGKHNIVTASELPARSGAL